MTTYNFATEVGVTPTTQTWELVTNTRTFQSPLTNAVQTQTRKGSYWKTTATFNNLTGADRAKMQAFLAKLDGQVHRMYFTDYGYNRSGNAPSGDSITSLTAGSLVSGITYKITSVGTTDFTAIGASSNTVGVVFQATGAGTGTGTVVTVGIQVKGASQTGSSLIADGADLSNTDYFKAGDYIAFNNEFHIVTADCSTDGLGEITIPIAPPLRKSPDDNDPINFVTPLAVMIVTSTASWDTRPGRVSNFTIEAIEDVLA